MLPGGAACYNRIFDNPNRFASNTAWIINQADDEPLNILYTRHLL